MCISGRSRKPLMFLSSMRWCVFPSEWWQRIRQVREKYVTWSKLEEAGWDKVDQSKTEELLTKVKVSQSIFRPVCWTLDILLDLSEASRAEDVPVWIRHWGELNWGTLLQFVNWVEACSASLPEQMSSFTSCLLRDGLQLFNLCSRCCLTRVTRVVCSV